MQPVQGQESSDSSLYYKFHYKNVAVGKVVAPITLTFFGHIHCKFLDTFQRIIENKIKLKKFRLENGLVRDNSFETKLVKTLRYACQERTQSSGIQRI